MVELVVRVRDKVGDDLYHDAAQTKRGDVIEVRPDGFGWGRFDLREPDWRILRLPHVPIEEAEHLLTPEPEVSPQHPSRVLQRRLFSLMIDSDLWDADTQRWWADDSRAQPIRQLDLNVAQFRALIRRKSPRHDPYIFGDPRNIIG